ncbi:MAG: LysR family transcriptional regulator, partial [Lachnospiraceae bacterium]|nr:LysR family transcriptional regulator [Lachnospiraceae bacterium]
MPVNCRGRVGHTEFSTMKAFAKVTECRNISKASKELFISQPALSKKMSDLEKELGVALLVRD